MFFMARYGFAESAVKPQPTKWKMNITYTR